MAHLYEITEQMKQLEKLGDDGEIDQQALADTFEGLEGEFEQKAIALIQMTSNMNADIDQLDEMIKRLQARKKVLQNKKESWRDYLRTNMDAAGISKIECPYFAITLRKGQKVVDVYDEDLLPDEYVDIELVTKPRKRDILQALKDGEDIPGATMKEGQKSLLIK